MSPRVWVMALTAMASFMVALDTLVVSTALSTIQGDLGATVAELEWTVNSYNLSFAVLILTAAALGDRFGRRRMFTAGLATFVAGSAACALATDVGWLIAARTLQGVGAALVMPLALALLIAAFPAERRGMALGVFGGITGLAVSSGPFVGGAVVEGIAWEWIFWINVPLGLLVIPLALRHVPESLGTDTALDVGGLALITGGAFGLVWGSVRGNTAGWGSAEVLFALVAGTLMTVAFVLWEMRTAQPMLPMHLFRSRKFSTGNAAIFLLFASLFGTVFLMAQFFQTGLDYGPLETGLRMLPWTAMPMLVTPVAGALADRYGERPFMVAGLLLQSAGLGWVAIVAEPGGAYSGLLPGLIVSGIGIGMGIPAAQNAAMGAAAPDAIGKAAGTNSMVRELGGVLGIAAVVAVFAAAGSYANPAAFTDGFAPAIAVAAALAFLGAATGLGLPGRPRIAADSPARTPASAFTGEGGT